MGTILENHTLHIVNEDKTSEKLTGVMIQVNDIESVFHVRTAKKCSIPPVIKSVCAFDNMCKIKFHSSFHFWKKEFRGSTILNGCRALRFKIF